jgi:hypothetical protein
MIALPRPPHSRGGRRPPTRPALGRNCRLKPLGSIPRDGFETAMVVRASDTYVAVRTEDRLDRTFGTSAPVQALDGRAKAVGSRQARNDTRAWKDRPRICPTRRSGLDNQALETLVVVGGEFLLASPGE